MIAKERAAMQMALKALEEAHTVIEHKQDVRKREEAITALREALAQPQVIELADSERSQYEARIERIRELLTLQTNAAEEMAERLFAARRTNGAAARP